ncbi:MAG: hypothetical protein L0332_16995 [Chloroflexi bacterium]|nr:hypothetical protein [Chloroflexota bacterium]MCI0581006.1 hypothetical protein [Chloroflexota bacterium]MCI0646345.1 hypothetical protein [Chloroflexota bacterium]MCI0728397.1 hypothetical protein [Chloroflexota bacterium]
MVFAREEIPVAYSMLELAEVYLVKQTTPPYAEFLCFWAAFNNIYVKIADQKKGGQAKRPGEKAQIVMAVNELGDDLKHQLITHDSTRFFAYRIPSWRGHKIEYDASGKKLNGVLNVGRTTSSRHPVWSPIDTKLYENYMQGDQEDVNRDALAEQIVLMLYTVRNNLFHGGKRADDADDNEVLEKALSLVAMVVKHFIKEEDLQAIQEREIWLHFSASQLSYAYGENEPDYSLDLIKEPNPKYERG